MNVSRTKLIGISLVLLAVTVWLYWPTVHGEFLEGDDVEYLRQSEQWNGLTWNAVKWAFTCTESYYHPLVRLSHVLDYQLFGRNAAGHHATGIVIHALNAALVLGFLWTLLGATALTTGERLAVASWVALVFAIHPLQTESLAWMSGRTQQLCTMFGIGCLWTYAAGGRRWVVWGLYVLALLCKPMAVSFPFVMLAMDYYPLRRHEQLGWGRLLREKAVWIALAGAAGLATVVTKTQIGQMIPLAKVPLTERVLLVFESLMFYPLKLIWPSRLLPVYQMSLGLSLYEWPVLGSVASVIIITAVVIMGRRRVPALAAAWGAYVVLVLPVSGLMPTVMQAVATRFAYVAMLPLLLVAGGAGVWVWRRSTMAPRFVLVGLLAGQLCAFGLRTRGLIPVWHDDESERLAELEDSPGSEEGNRILAVILLDKGRTTEALKYAQQAVKIAPQLWVAHMTLGYVLDRLGRRQEAMARHEEAFRLNGNSVQAQYNFGVALMEMGMMSRAAEHFEQALRLKPDYAEAHNNLAGALDRAGKIEEAIAQYEEALRFKPDYAEAYNNLGNIFSREGKLNDGIRQYEQALRFKPDSAETHYNLGVALELAKRLPDATAQYEEALRLKPDYAGAYNKLGNVFLREGKLNDGIRQYEQALRFKPDSAETHYDLGVALMKMGRMTKAIAHFEQALRIDPGLVRAHYSLAVTLEKVGKIEEAIVHYGLVLQIQPDFAAAHYRLGNALFSLGQTTEAITQYQEVLRIQPDDAEAHSNWGLALAQTGKIKEAIAHYEQALQIQPCYAEAHYNLGNALAQTGKIEEAIAQYEQALQIQPDDAEAHSNLGNALAQTGKIEEAIAQYEQALRIQPDFAEVHFNLGIALVKMGRVPEAIQHYQRALSLRPDLTAARNELARLRGSR